MKYSLILLVAIVGAVWLVGSLGRSIPLRLEQVQRSSIDS